MSSKVNLTVDDFDPIVAYSNYDEWTTPNPQDNPTWFNASQDVTGSQWHQATYHLTTVSGAQASFNFTGNGLWVYGGTGTSPNYTITLDSSSSQPFTSSYSTPNLTDGRTLLYGTDQLAYAEHQLVLTNHGDGLLLDLIVVGVELGGDSATLANTTLDDRASELQYSGSWTQQTGPNFYNQTSTYTGGPGPYFELNFTGSAVYIYGDQVNDHGPYSVYINDTNVATHTGRSGCGGGYAKYCEKVHGLVFFAGSLPEGQHTLRLVNEGPSSGNTTYFDFDYLEYTVPSVYSSQTVESASCPFTNCTSASAASTSGTAATGAAGQSSSTAEAKSSAGLPTSASNAALLAVAGTWLLRKFIN